METSSLIPLDGITNTKQAAVLATLGLNFARPGIYKTFDEDHPPKATGGTAHFLFESSASNTVQKYIRIYEEEIADVTLDDFLESLKAELPAVKHAELERHIIEALLVYGKKILKNYETLVRFIKGDVAKFVVTGGDPVYAEGRIAGIQNFSLRGLKNER